MTDGEKVWLRTTDGYDCVFSLADGTLLSRRRVTPWIPIGLGVLALCVLGMALHLGRRSRGSQTRCGLKRPADRLRELNEATARPTLGGALPGETA